VRNQDWLNRLDGDQTGEEGEGRIRDLFRKREGKQNHCGGHMKMVPDLHKKRDFEMERNRERGV